MDDIGASTKIYNQYGKTHWKVFGKNLPLSFFANWLFFKRIKPFAKWAIYNELNEEDWKKIFFCLRRNNANMTIGITAAWAISEFNIISFDQKFPRQTAILREGVEEGLIEIAHHGLTHCVLKDNAFLPKRFKGNRTYHREFWDWLPESYHKEHIEKAQAILISAFKTDIITFIPPGNVWTEITENYAASVGIKYLSSLESRSPTGKKSNGIFYIGNENMIDFHDREIALYGIAWLEKRMNPNIQYCTVKDYLD